MALLLRPPLRSSPLPKPQDNLPRSRLRAGCEQMARADEVRAQLGEFALLEMRETLHEFLAGDESQHRIADELQLLVVQRIAVVRAPDRAVPARTNCGSALAPEVPAFSNLWSSASSSAAISRVFVMEDAWSIDSRPDRRLLLRGRCRRDVAAGVLLPVSFCSRDLFLRCQVLAPRCRPGCT